ncbi:metal ion binding [Pyrenophora seminiperda CCB06]|uniref:Metal ion binding n=1 Tax=Pyrenophora seminiperda CCB06 TaxID=1302712 RepID=A0A3M7M4B6_9PLEO|nr:metal ion binding [Pyrenophora seminiperda CCB06]
MNTTAAPQLRRSKRKLNERAAKEVPESINNDALAPQKRARRARTAEPSIVKESLGKVQGTGSHTISARPQQKNYTLPSFLALPRELRDEIYRHVLHYNGSSCTLKVEHCGLLGVNSQISDEFVDAMLFHASVIRARVRNHNFAPVVTFLNRLSEAQFARLSGHGPHAAEGHADDANPKCKILIQLCYSAGAKDGRAQLNRWLDRFDAPNKRGKEFEFEYDCDATYENGGYKQRPRLRAKATERWNKEADNIRTAARERSAWTYFES